MSKESEISEESKEEYQYFSERLSTVARQLAFAEGSILITFLIKGVEGCLLKVGILSLVLYFYVDIFQYALGFYASREDIKKKRKKRKSSLHQLVETMFVLKGIIILFSSWVLVQLLF